MSKPSSALAISTTSKSTVANGEANLTYTLVEKPSVVEIVYAGNSDVETSDLQEAAALKAFEILNMNKVREAVDKMQKVYEDKGFFLAKITPRIENIAGGESVKVVFDIQENDKVKVKRITILGNRNILDARIKGAMQTQEGGFFSFISGSGAYKQDAFDRDVQLIQYMYFNEGYVQVRVDRPQVYVTPDKKGIYITLRVEEGDRFKVGSVDLAGDLLFERDELFNAINIDGSGWYAHETLLADLRSLQAKYGDLG
ncbi:MAG: outer membrane protein assembly factor BamA, partial [Proteobacteria bacterium]